MKHINNKMHLLKPGMLHKYLEISSNPDILSLTIGEPDFPTPYHIREAGIKAIEDGKTFYTPSKGLLSLRKEIANFYERSYHLTYDPTSEILTTIGASEGIELALRTLLNEDDEVIVVGPAYLSYEPLILMAGAKVIEVQTSSQDGFKLKADILKDNITDKTRIIVLNYPNNPTGAIMTLDDYIELEKVLVDKEIYVISDEIYSELNYTGLPHASMAQIPSMKEKTIVLNGFSKAYSMTGWRLGYILAHKDLIDLFVKYHQNAILCPPTISQFAGIEALKNGDSDIEHMRSQYDMRRRYAVDKLNSMGLTVSNPDGAFYLFTNVKEKTGLDSETFCEQLLESQKVAVIPGIGFGETGRDFIRFSYCYSLEHIKEALEKIEVFLKQLAND